MSEWCDIWNRFLRMALVVPPVILAVCAASCGNDEEGCMTERNRMIEQDIKGRGVKDPRVLDAMMRVPRHLFVGEDFRDRAYEDRPLPIGEGQTISQPFMVAAMTELIDPKPGDTVLEVGTGSGYQAAVLAELVDHVYTVEILPALGERARALFQRLEYGNISVRIGDGYAGWPEHAPYDGIIVTCGADEVPEPLVEQLKPGSSMVIPVGPFHQVQELLVITKQDDGGVTRRSVMPVRFVPMTGGRYDRFMNEQP